MEADLARGPAITFGLLSLSLLSLWLPAKNRRVEPWILLLVCCVFAAGHFGQISLPGVAVLSLVALLAWQKRSAQALSEIWLSATLFLGGLLLLGHLAPGFSNPLVLDSVVVKADGAPYSKYLNLDKAALGLLLLGVAGNHLQTARRWLELVLRVTLVGVPLVLLLMAPAYFLNYVRVDPGLPDIWLFWAWTNLLFTCVAEEALFRHLLQGDLQRLLHPRPWAQWTAILVAAVSFGLAHAAGGGPYVALASLAGVGYGWVYAKTGRVEASILLHFMVNASHFYFFTYPALA